MEFHLICRAKLEYKDSIDFDKITSMSEFRSMEAYDSKEEAWKAKRWHSQNDGDAMEYTYFVISNNDTYESLDEYIKFCENTDAEGESE